MTLRIVELIVGTYVVFYAVSAVAESVKIIENKGPWGCGVHNLILVFCVSWCSTLDGGHGVNQLLAVVVKRNQIGACSGTSQDCDAAVGHLVLLAPNWRCQKTKKMVLIVVYDQPKQNIYIT